MTPNVSNPPPCKLKSYNISKAYLDYRILGIFFPAAPNGGSVRVRAAISEEPRFVGRRKGEVAHGIEGDGPATAG